MTLDTAFFNDLLIRESLIDPIAARMPGPEGRGTRRLCETPAREIGYGDDRTLNANATEDGMTSAAKPPD